MNYTESGKGNAGGTRKHSSSVHEHLKSLGSSFQNLASSFLVSRDGELVEPGSSSKNEFEFGNEDEKVAQDES